MDRRVRGNSRVQRRQRWMARMAVHAAACEVVRSCLCGIVAITSVSVAGEVSRLLVVVFFLLVIFLSIALDA